jgi:1-phosphatidylinositol-4-phosphate 5-kinase
MRHNHDMMDADYLMTIAGNFSYYPFTSNSKSGCYFWLSRDRRFIIKTVTHKEARLLFKMLPAWYDHQIKNPDSLINPIFGLHRLELGRPRPALYFIVIRVCTQYYHSRCVLYLYFYSS